MATHTARKQSSARFSDTLPCLDRQSGGRMSSTQTIDFPLASEPRKPGARIDFSMGGLVYCAMMLFMGLAAINTQANLLFGVFGLMIGVLLLAWYVGRRVLRDLEVRRVIPAHAIAGTGITSSTSSPTRK